MKTLFQPASSATLERMIAFNQTAQHTFLMPTKFIAAEAGQVGWLLHSYYNLGRPVAEHVTYRSFFANSRYEAMQGAIKLARHKALTRSDSATPPGITLVYDPTEELRYFVDPLQRGEDDALIPGLRLITDLATVETELAAPSAPLALLIYPGAHAALPEPQQLAALLQICHERTVISILCLCDRALAADPPPLQPLPRLPDILVTGESLTAYEIPFGAFTMREDIHQPWAGVLDCFLHSSTYAGNRLALSMARDQLLAYVPAFRNEPTYAAYCHQIASGDAERRAAFARFVNPGLVTMYGMVGLDMHPQRASGALLTASNATGEERTLIDCVTGGGAVARGHNPPDLVAEVLQRHDPQHDYWSDLAATLRSFALPYAFPAVSGATAVDLGMTLAMLASGTRRKLVVFEKNYAGRTLLALSATQDGFSAPPFRPLYAHTVCFDPHDPTTPEALSTLLASGEVALVWFELIQGENKRMLPQTILDTIESHKAAGGYFVGVDEVLMGLYRVGRLLSSEGLIVEPDIITLAKPLSDGVFPMAATLVSERLYQHAYANHPQTVQFLAERYRNQLGAHVALHALAKLRDPAFVSQVHAVAALLAAGMAKIATTSPVLRSVTGQGHIYHFFYHLVDPEQPDLEFFQALYMCNYLIEHANAFFFFDSCSPPLNLTPAQATQLLDQLQHALARDPETILAGYPAFLERLFSHLEG